MDRPSAPFPKNANGRQNKYEGHESLATELWCRACTRAYAPSEPSLTCACGGPLEQLYDFEAARHAKPAPGSTVLGDSLWRYRVLLPIASPDSIVSLGEGGTPLIPLPEISERLGATVLLKDEGRNPTGTFKARGASVAVSRLTELGYTSLALPTVGNGGSAWTAYAARAGISIQIGRPDLADLPPFGRVEPQIYGASVRDLEGDTHTAYTRFRSSLRDNVQYVGPWSEPYRTEGDKTLTFELSEQLGWQSPDFVFRPTGGGVSLVALAKGFDELKKTHWLESETSPHLVAVQHASCPPIAEALRDGLVAIREYSAAGIAPGVWVGKPFAGSHILEATRSRTTAGGAVADDEEIISAGRQLAREEGILLSPEGSLALAGLLSYARRGFVPTGSIIVVVNTSTPYRYPGYVDLLMG